MLFSRKRCPGAGSAENGFQSLHPIEDSSFAVCSLIVPCPSCFHFLICEMGAEDKPPPSPDFKGSKLFRLYVKQQGLGQLETWLQRVTYWLLSQRTQVWFLAHITVHISSRGSKTLLASTGTGQTLGCIRFKEKNQVHKEKKAKRSVP